MKRELSLAAMALFSAVVPARATLEEAIALKEQYEVLQEWKFSDSPVSIPSHRVQWVVGGAEFELENGSLRFSQPTAAGDVTGFVFEGRGTIRIGVDNPLEARQLGRFLETGASSFEADFTELVGRSADLSFLGELQNRSRVTHTVDGTARERHDHWLRMRWHDADARVVAALANAGDSYFRADLRTVDHGWVTVEFDRRRREELRVSTFKKRNSVVETWLSLDVEDDARLPGTVALEHLDVQARLIKVGKNANFSEASRTTLLGEFTAHCRFRAETSGDRAIVLHLHPMARVLEVRDEGGQSLPFLRDHIGSRSKGLDKRLFDSTLVVLLPKATATGELLEFEFEYELEITNYVPGRSWYPTGELRDQGPTNRHTARLSIETRDELDIRAMGTLESEAVGSGLRTATWVVDKPAKMVTFAVTRKMIEREFEVEGLPKVVVFAPPVGHDTENRLQALGADVANSLAYFQELYDDPLANEVLYATLIQAGHGQAFDGFLHLTEQSAFRDASAGVVELFLAHEVAHEWWGHRIGWASYRDQWLSEGMAQYAAMMFIEATMEKGEKIFREIVTAYRDELTGSMGSAMSHFTDFGRVQTSRVAAARIGPIAHGWRAATAEAPGAYTTQTYTKGAMVAHMLRGTLSFLPNGEEVFRKILRGLAKRHRDGEISTADMIAEVERHAPGEWEWFFEQWVERAEIPTYKWRASVSARPDQAGNYPVELSVRRQGVSDDFRMHVPVEAVFGKDRHARVLVNVTRDHEVFELSFPERPKKVVFNPDAAVLAKTENSRK